MIRTNKHSIEVSFTILKYKIYAIMFFIITIIAIYLIGNELLIPQIKKIAGIMAVGQPPFQWENINLISTPLILSLLITFLLYSIYHFRNYVEISNLGYLIFSDIAFSIFFGIVCGLFGIMMGTFVGGVIYGFTLSFIVSIWHKVSMFKNDFKELN